MRITTILTVCAALAVAAPARADDGNENAGVGMYHNGLLSLSILTGDIAAPTEEGMPAPPLGTEEAATMFYGYFGAAFLEVPSSYGNRHGLEIWMDLLTKPFDMNLAFGFPFTMITIGKGGPLTSRLGGVIGFGVGYKGAFGYGGLRGTGVLIPGRLDGELQVLWTPQSAYSAWSDGDHEILNIRASLFYTTAGGTTIQAFLQLYDRTRAAVDMSGNDIEITVAKGGGIGLGLAF